MINKIFQIQSKTSLYALHVRHTEQRDLLQQTRNRLSESSRREEALQNENQRVIFFVCLNSFLLFQEAQFFTPPPGIYIGLYPCQIGYSYNFLPENARNLKIAEKYNRINEFASPLINIFSLNVVIIL